VARKEIILDTLEVRLLAKISEAAASQRTVKKKRRVKMMP